MMSGWRRCCCCGSVFLLLLSIVWSSSHASFVLLPVSKQGQNYYKRHVILQRQRRRQAAAADSSSSSSSFSNTSPSFDTNDDSIDNMVVNGAPLVVSSQTEKTKLASAFAALDEGDQYDAVLTGLCAKILDDADVDEAKSLVQLQDPLALLTEMNSRKVAASGRSLMALVDACAKTHDARAMAHVLSLCLVNHGGVLSEYGALQANILPLPTSPTSTVTCPDGVKRTRQERLDGLVEVPTDDRGTEVAAALAASSVIGFCVVCNILHFNDITPYTNTILTLLVTIGIVDNFYDVLKGILSIVKTQVNALKEVELPEKEEMPLSLGTGQVSGTVVRGLSRLSNIDTERECECEAAAFFVAYSLGLPCFAFRPNALEAAVLVLESMKKSQDFSDDAIQLDPLLSSAGILKVLVWLMAPVAMESSKHLQLIVSDPREGAGFLERLVDKSDLLDTDNKQDLMFWKEEEQDLLKWAYAEADLLLRNNKATLEELTQRLAGGAATVGDCVAVLERW